MAKEYKSNLLKRTITGLIIAIPLVCIVVLENYWVLIALLSFISIAGFYEWIKNGFRHPMLWGFSLKSNVRENKFLRTRYRRGLGCLAPS